MLNPSYYAWINSGSPDVFQKYAKYVTIGECSLCNNQGDVLQVKRIVSSRFANWEDYSNITKPVWCMSCAWSFNEGNNRSEAKLITPTAVYSCYQVQSLKPLLAEPLNANRSLSVALKKNKHVLAYATWNRIKVEDVSLPWSLKEIALEGHISKLLQMGFLLQSIRTEDSPPSIQIMKLSRDEAKTAYLLWDMIKELHYSPHLFNFMIAINKKSTMEYTINTIKE